MTNYENFDYEAAFAAENNWRDLLAKGEVEDFCGVEWVEPLSDTTTLCGICAAQIDDDIASKKTHEDYHRDSHRVSEVVRYRFKLLSKLQSQIADALSALCDEVIRIDNSIILISQLLRRVAKAVKTLAER